MSAWFSIFQIKIASGLSRSRVDLAFIAVEFTQQLIVAWFRGLVKKFTRFHTAIERNDFNVLILV